MRIAILVYGRLNKCAEHYNNIIESFGEHNNIDFFASSDNSAESLLNDFIALYKPIKFTNDPIHYDYDLGKYPNKHCSTNVHNMTCHFINKNRVFVLLEEHITRNNIQYDCVVSLRIDCVFQHTFLFDSLDDNTIYIPSGSDFSGINGFGGINDQFAYGKMDVMKKYHSLNAVDLLEKNLTTAHPESLNYANIHYHKLNVQRPDISYYLAR